MAPLLGGELIGKRYKKIHSLKTNIAPEKRRSEKSEKETSIPTIPFSGAMLPSRYRDEF